MIASACEVDIEVFRRYAGISLPRHVAYPMPTWWRGIDRDQARSMYRDQATLAPDHDLSLYVHIPFCETLCKFCACNRVIQRKGATGAVDRTDRYVAALLRDIRELAAAVDSDRPVRQIHYGGGSPMYLSDGQISEIQSTIRECFKVAADAEVAIEVDPRNVTAERAGHLRQVGFNRVSMGVQDFNEAVQKHVHRIQPFDQVRRVVDACRDVGFTSVNFDLIYGMPYQTPETIRETVEQTITLSPNRIAYYHYAQIPEKIATQRGMDYTKLPDSETKLEMFLIGLRTFENAGYEFIGLDHFAKSDEALATARDDGSLQRNFQGMTTGGGLHLLGAGASSISHLLGVGFQQNIKDTDGYIERLEQGESPAERGLSLSFDDRVRQAVINQLYCFARIVPRRVEERFDIVFSEYFARELGILGELERDGIVTLESSGEIGVTCPLGRVLMRNVAAVFDTYLAPDAYKSGEQVCFSINA